MVEDYQEISGLDEKIILGNNFKKRLNRSNSFGSSSFCRSISHNIVPPYVRSISYNGLSIVVNEDNTFSVNGIVNSNSEFSVVLSIPFDFSPYFDKEMTISCGYYTTNNIGSITSALFTNDNSLIAWNVFNVTGGRSSYTKIVDSSLYDLSNGSMLRLHFYVPSGHLNEEINISGYFQIEEGSIVSNPVSYDGCLYGLELYDTIESNFITDNYYINCGIIALFLALIIILVNAPFIFIRKIKGN